MRLLLIYLRKYEDKMTRTLKENYETKKELLLKEEFKRSVLLVERIETKILDDAENYREKLEFLKSIRISGTYKAALEVEIDKHLNAIEAGGNEKEFTGSVIAAGAFLAVLEQGISQLNTIFNNFFGRRKFTEIKNSNEKIKYLADERETRYLEDVGSESLKTVLMTAFSPAESSTWQTAKNAVKNIASGLLKFFRFGNPADKKFNEDIDEIMTSAIMHMSMKDVQKMIAEWEQGPSIENELGSVIGSVEDDDVFVDVDKPSKNTKKTGGPTYGAKNPKSLLDDTDDFSFADDEDYKPTAREMRPIPPPRNVEQPQKPLTPEKISPDSPLLDALIDKARVDLKLGRSSFAMNTTKNIMQWLASQGKLTEAMEKGMITVSIDKKALSEILKRK